MFKEIKLPFNMSVLELLTIAAFAAIGYSIIYKYSFYSTLRVDWYLYSLQPNYILFSSIKLIFLILVGALLGGAILKPITSLIKTIIIYLGFYIISVIIIIFISDYWVFGIGRSNITILIMGIFLSILIKISLLIINSGEIGEKYKYYFILFIVVGLSFLSYSIPSLIGERDAKNLITNPKSNLVKIKNEKGEWFLIELNVDKALIMNKKDNKLFKLMEYKDIDTIRVE